VESWGEPWNEGYKNLAKYIYEMLKHHMDIYVLTSKKIEASPLKESDLIHIFNYTAPFHKFAPLIVSRYRKPVVKHVAKKELDLGIRTITRTLLNSTFVWNALITTTDVLAREVRRLVKNKPVFYLPPPIPVNYFKKLHKDACRELLGLEGDKTYVGYTGTLNEFRKLDVVLKALKLIDNKGERIELVLSLTNLTSNGLELLKRAFASNRITPNQYRLVNVKDVRIIYSAVDALIYPVEREGAVEPPLTVLEAMSCECIVIAYRNAITSNLLSDGYNGFLFSSTEDLVKILRDLINRGPDEVIARNARKTVMDGYDPSMLRKSYVELYGKLISGK